MDNKDYMSGVFFILLSAVGLSITGLLGKIGFESLTLPGMVFWRYLTGFLFCLFLFFLARKLEEGISLEAIKMQGLRALFLLGSQYCFYFFLERNSLLNAMALLNTGPLFIPIFERWILGQHIPKSAWIGIGISFVGVILVLQPNAAIFSYMSLVGLTAGFCQGASQVVFGINTKRDNSNTGVFILMFLAAFASFIPYLFTRATFTPGHHVDIGIVLLLMGLGIASVINQFFRSEAYKRGSPSRLAAFLYFSVLLAGFYDWAFFDLAPDPLSVLGAVLIICGGLLKIYIHLTRDRPEE